MTELWIPASPQTVQWGYLSALEDPIAHVRSGDTVRIDTVSHEGLMPDQGEPAQFFERFGVPAPQVQADAIEIYARVQHSTLGPHIITGPVHVAAAEPGDVLIVDILDVVPRVPYGVNSMRLGKGALPG
jgi:acetamidase/formamidase